MELILTEQQLGSYKALIKTEPSVLSPLPRFAKRAKGESVDIPNKAKEMLQALANTTATAHIKYSDRNISIDTAAYYPDADELNGVMLSATDEGVTVKSPPDKERLKELLLLYIGDSKLDRVNVELDLLLTEAAALFAMIDVRRKQRLSDLLGKKTGDITTEDLLKAMREKSHRLQWLSPLFVKAVGKGLPSEKNITAAFEKIRTEEKIETLTDEFLLIDSHVRIRGAISDGSVVTQATDIHVAGGRSGALFMWSINGKRVEIQSISPLQLLMLIDMLMRPTDQAEPYKSYVCSQCNATLEDDDKFCTSCGSAV